LENHHKNEVFSIFLKGFGAMHLAKRINKKISPLAGEGETAKTSLTAAVLCQVHSSERF
jgi:hypothetical protein